MRKNSLFSFNCSLANMAYRAKNNFLQKSSFSKTIDQLDANPNVLIVSLRFALTEIFPVIFPVKVFDSFRHLFSEASKILNHY